MNIEASHSHGSHPIPTRDASMEVNPDDQVEELMKEEKETQLSSYNNRLMLPSDGYEWKKYGQKFIKNIGKFRSYFKCQRIDCGAKKTAEWCRAAPSNIRVVYNGQHTHDSWTAAKSSSAGSTSAATNPYNLFTQVFGDR